MKICLYLEFSGFAKNTGIGNSIKHQIDALNKAKVDFTLDADKFDYDVLHMNSWGIKSYIKLLKAKKRGIKVVISTHSTVEDQKDSFFIFKIFSPFFKKWFRFFYSKADLLIAPSYYTKNLLIDAYGLRNRIEVISNGVDVDKFKYDGKKAKAFKKEYGIKDNLILSVGLIIKRKGVLDFAELSSRIQAKFIWIGRYMKLLVESKEINTIMKRRQTNLLFLQKHVEDITAAYSACDIFLFPSFEENEGIVILEAASTGRAIVVRDITVFRTYLQDGKNCMMAKSNTDFEKIINRLLADKKLRNKLGKEARKFALTRCA
ncbi:MAG: glycosyltransferase family 4 protein, partial [Nanoarchaeota archaeon]